MAKKYNINPSSIKEIQVEELFGYYTYKLSKTKLSQDLSKLIILYGTNGSGKTTILKLVFYLLSYRDQEGHKSALSRYKFKKFSVKLGNGVEIGASRRKCSNGSFTYYVKKNGKQIDKIYLKTSQDFFIRLDESSQANLTLIRIFNYIKKLNIRLFYLTDNRETMDTLDTPFSVKEEHRRNLRFHSGDESSRYEEDMGHGNRGLLLNYTLRKLSDWIRQHAIKGSRIGEENTIAVYSNIVKRVIRSTKKSEKNIATLVETLKQLTIRSKEYAELGLITPLEYKEITKALRNVKGKKINIVYNIIEPFVEGLKTRLEALSDLKNAISNLIKTINYYFSDKELSFDISKGFKIIHLKTGETINFDDLSSGEKQFLWLISNTITASEDATIFIIDEPEISLNVKWQRSLIKTLLEFSKTTNVQFLIATHSIELLTSHSRNVLQLKTRD